MRRSGLRLTAAALGAGVLLAGAVGTAAMAVYFFAHPDVNTFFSGLTANPDVRAELEAIRAPSRVFRDRCNLPQQAMILADQI